MIRLGLGVSIDQEGFQPNTNGGLISQALSSLASAAAGTNTIFGNLSQAMSPLASAIAGSSISPKSIPNLAAWWRLDLGVTVVTGVSSLLDQSGNGDSNRNAVQANTARQPLYSASDAHFNGRPSMAFDIAVNQFLLTGTWTVPLTQPFTCFMVARDIGGNGGWAWDSSAGGEVGISQQGTSTKIYAGSFGAGAATSINVTNSLVGVFDSANTNSKLYVSQNTPQAGASIGTNAPSPLIIGNAQGGGASNDGWTIAELAFWTRALTSGEVANLNTYAYNLYAITIGA